MLKDVRDRSLGRGSQTAWESMRISRILKFGIEADPYDHLAGIVLATPWKQRLRTENEHGNGTL